MDIGNASRGMIAMDALNSAIKCLNANDVSVFGRGRRTLRARVSNGAVALVA